MSKVLVDRELLERCVDRWACCAIVETPGAEQAWLELRAVVKAAYPAEADGFQIARHSKRLVEQLREQLSAVTADRDRLRDAAGKAIAWLDAEQNESGVGINRRIKLCRDAENSLRAAMAAKEA